MNDQRFSDVEDLALSMTLNFNWQCVTRTPDAKHFFKAICTTAILLGRLTNSTGDVYAASDALGKAAYKGNVDEVRNWSFGHYEWRTAMLRNGDRIPTIQVIAGVLASFFEGFR